MSIFEQKFETIISNYKADPPENKAFSVLNKNSKVILFGAGLGGYEMFNKLRLIGIAPICFCDNIKSGIDAVTGLNIVSPKKLLNEYSSAYIIISVGDKFYDEIKNQLINIGISKARIIEHYWFSEKQPLDFVISNKQNYKWLYENVADEFSKEVILNIIKHYLFYFEIPHTAEYERYFDKNILNITDNEVFVDGGGYIGDSSLDFIKKVNGFYNEIHLFEPDNDNYLTACKNLSSAQNVYINNVGLWSNDGEQKFCSGDKTMSHFSVLGDSCVKTVSLDNYFSKKSSVPTLIKMDIQAAEKEAILGSKNILTNNMPKLAICIYHKFEDLYELPMLIKKIQPLYKFSIRHYSYSNHETVLYAY